MNGLEVRELQYFIALAEELHFGRAAERLHLAQPALSRAIKRLEAKLGVRVVERTTRNVALTAEGEALLEHGRAAVDAVGAAARRARRAGRAALIVTTKSTDARLAAAIVDRFASPAPELPRAEVRIGGWGEQTAMLRDGRADAAVLRTPFDAQGLRVATLYTEPRVAVIPGSHRFAGRRRLRLDELAGEPRPTWPGADRLTADYWAATEDGPPAPPGPTVSDLSQTLEVVALGQAIAFLPASIVARNERPDLVAIPVSGLSPSSIAMAWPERAASPAIRQLVRAARDVAGTAGAELATAV
jgi:DNA-binding transcriptional LysR family regulator